MERAKLKIGLKYNMRLQMLKRILTVVIEGLLAIIIFGGIGVMLAWRG
jgi:hypothetical protein